MSPRRHIRHRAIGDTFTAPAATSTTCPPGFHWEDDQRPIRGLRGLGACVPDKVATLRLPAKPATTIPAPVTTSAPATTDAAAAPPVTVTLPTQATTCPAPWSLWWLLVAAAAGAGAGVYFAAEDTKKRRRNGRIAA